MRPVKAGRFYSLVISQEGRRQIGEYRVFILSSRMDAQSRSRWDSSRALNSLRFYCGALKRMFASLIQVYMVRVFKASEAAIHCMNNSIRIKRLQI